MFLCSENILGILQGRKQMILQFELVIIEFIIKEGGVNY